MVTEIVAKTHDFVPQYKTEHAAGADLYSTVTTNIAPGDRKLIPTGCRVAIPNGHFGAVVSRSGLALKQGIIVLNAPGIIDSDYRGEIGIILYNSSNVEVVVEAGERIAQLILCPYVKMEFQQVVELSETQRGSGGFGSTGA